MVYINNGEQYNPHELPHKNLGSSLNTDNAVSMHTDFGNKLPDKIQKLEYMYEHFQDCEKVHELDPDLSVQGPDNTIYPHINNGIECS